MEYSEENLRETSTGDLYIFLNIAVKCKDRVLEQNPHLFGNNYHDSGDWINPVEADAELKANKDLFNHYSNCEDLIKIELYKRFLNVFPL